MRPLADRLRAWRRVSAATTRSMRMKREPLTSTVDAGRARRASCVDERVDRRRSACAPAPNAATASRASVAHRVQPRDAALARVRADLAMERGALRADLAHVAQHEAARARRLRPARRSPRAPNPDSRCTCRRSRARRAVARRATSRPATARNASSPRTTASSDAPAASAAAVAASALRAMCRPGTASVTSQRAVGRRDARACCRRRAGRTLAVTSAPRSSAERRPRARPRARAAARHDVGVRIVGVEHGDAAAAAAPATASACSAATSATLAMNSWCSRCALLTTTIVGCAIARELARLAAMVHAELDRPPRDARSRRRSSVSGRPIALLRLPSVASTAVVAEVRAQDRRESSP